MATADPILLVLCEIIEIITPQPFDKLISADCQNTPTSKLPVASHDITLAHWGFLIQGLTMTN